MNEPRRSTTSGATNLRPPPVPVERKRDWQHGRVFLATGPCPHCGQDRPRHRWPIPRGMAADVMLGTQFAPCNKGLVYLVERPEP